MTPTTESEPIDPGNRSGLPPRRGREDVDEVVLHPPAKRRRRSFAALPVVLSVVGLVVAVAGQVADRATRRAPDAFGLGTVPTSALSAADQVTAPAVPLPQPELTPAEDLPEPELPPAFVRLAYATPQGVAPIAGRIEAIRHEVGQIEAWFAAQTAGAHPRFARSPDGSVEVASLELPITAAELEPMPDPLPVLAPPAVAATGAGVLDVVLVFVEAGDGGESCGLGSGSWRLAVVWIQSCAGAPSVRSRFPRGATWIAAHELAHALGAVAGCAPNASPDGHVTDRDRDLMWPEGPPADGRVELDLGEEDYRAARPDCPPFTDHPAWAGAG